MKNPSRRDFLIKTGLGTGSYALNGLLFGSGSVLFSQTANAATGTIVPLSTAAACVNISGLEWNSVTSRMAGMYFNLAGTLSVTQDAYLKYLSAIGIKKVRLPVMWEAIQPVLFDCPYNTGGVAPYVSRPGMLHGEVVAIIQRNLDSCARYGMSLILDIHNYGSYLDFNYQDGGTWSSPAGTPWYKAANAAAKGYATFNGNSSTCTIDTGTLPVGQPIVFTPGADGILPPEITAGTIYYVASASGSSLALSSSASGPVINFTISSTGTINRDQPAATVSKSFKNGQLTAAHMVDLFTKMVAAFDSYPALEGYGLMNEVGISGGITEAAWAAIAGTTISAIRTAGSTKRVFVDGPYTNAAATPYNASLISDVADPINNVAREVHWYLDANRSGSYFDWAYDQVRGFCVDVAGATGNVPQVGSARGISQATVSQLVSKPVFVGELGIPHTNDMYYAIAKDFIREARNVKSDICLWAASQNLYFPPALLIRPYVKRGVLLPSPPVSAILNDAGIEDAKIVSYVDIKTNTIIIEAYGSLTSPVTIKISDGGNGTIFSTSSVQLLPGVLTTGVISFTAPIKSKVTFTFSSSRAGIAAPAPVSVLKYQTDGSGNTIQGMTVLQNNRASIFIAGTGMATLAGGKSITTEALVPDWGLSDDRFAINNLTASPNGLVAISAGLNGKMAWNSGRSLNPGEYRTDFLVNTYTKPNTSADNYTGLNPPHSTVFTTKSSNWFMVCSFDRQNDNMAGQICGLYHSGKSYGISISGNNTTLRLGKLDAGSVGYVSNVNPTVIPASTKVTCIITNSNGLVTLYINGIAEASYTFTSGDMVLDSFGVLGGLAGYFPVASASANIRVYSVAIGVGSLVKADIIGITTYFNQ